MIEFSLAQVWAYKRRLAGTFLAIVVGVAFLAGTLLLGDTLRVNFDRLFSQASPSSELIVRSATTVGSSGGRDIRTGIDASLLSTVAAVPGVAAAVPDLEGTGQLTGRDGKGIGGNGPPTLAGNWISLPGLNPYRLAAGRAPQASGEVVINRGAAKSGHLNIGDSTTLLTPQPVRVRIVGIATYGTADGFGPSTFTGMTLADARHYLARDPGKLSSVLIEPAAGIQADQLLTRIRSALPPGLQAITGAQLAQENVDAINSGFLGFLDTALTMFAVIALLVAAFSIYNTFSIVAAQRARSAALLRALGATRRQVITASLVEAALVGAVGSAAGLAAGVAVAGGLKGVFNAFGFALPAGGLVITTGTAITAMAAGLAATVIAGILPAVRAASVPPVAVLREAAAEAPSVSPLRRRSGAALLLAGLAAATAAALAGRGGFVALGAVLTVIGMVVFGPVAVRPAALAIGTPIARLRGITGGMARQNALRNPRRTAATASPLLIGVAVVALFTVIGSSLKASATSGINQTLRADLVVYNGGYGGGTSGGGLSPGLADAIGHVPGVRLATGLSSGDVELSGTSRKVTAASIADLGQVADLGVTAGRLTPGEAGTIAVSKSAASGNNWHVGSVVPVVYPDGATAGLRVAAIYARTDVTGDYLLTQQDWLAHTRQVSVNEILVKLGDGGAMGTVRPAVEALTAQFGKPKVEDRAQYIASVSSGIGTILGLIYVLLVFAILIALMGIGNTLSLAIRERTRELGLLRAVGETRSQARAVIRWESVVIALFGTFGGVVLGTFLGWALVRASSSSSLAEFAAPVSQLVIFLVVGGVAGILAGLRPARRAARLPVLDALAAE